MLTENGQLAGAHEQYRPSRAKAFWEMVLCTPTCEREGDVSTINSLGVMRLVLAVCRLPRCDTGTARGYVWVALQRHRNLDLGCAAPGRG